MKKETTNKKRDMDSFDPKVIEPKWQKKWVESQTYKPDLDKAKKPFYNLMMFPYPSAEGLHVGSFFTYGGIDAYGRFKRMQGYDVFEPIGLDGFGIHSENYAIKVGRNPQEHARISEENFYRQLHLLGNGFDWSHKLETYDPKYYKWTQWLFTELFKAGLAYKAAASVNFCPSCKTVLSDEQVIDGKCERCSSVVEKRQLSQWFFRITDYAERLLANTENLDWTEKVKIAQKNWIGKKSGINITYKVKDSTQSITVFTTRPDTNFGATFLAIAPEHPLVHDLTTEDQRAAVVKYMAEAKGKTDIERQSEGKEKTGVFTGSYAVNDLTGYLMPIWVSDFVLAGFGTGALVGVPGHDKRDFEFAMKFGLEIKRVVVGPDGDTSPITELSQVQEDNGVMINSDYLTGMDIHAATEKIMDVMEEKGYGKRVVSYHLRDWLISRQRYWGPPIPMIHCEACEKAHKSWFTEFGDTQNNDAAMAGWYPVSTDDLPVLLPVVSDFKPVGTGKAPLANYPEFYETTCPGCGGKATRETDVSDTFLDSSWYFFRYLTTDRDDIPFPSMSFRRTSESISSKEHGSRIKSGMTIQDSDEMTAANRLKWLPVTSYIGGAEHAVLHLLYSRFVTMFLKDKGYIDFEEPYTKFRANGLIIKDGAKMSKSKGNVINPEDYIKKYGADTLRAYLGFIGPFTQGGDFQDTGIEGMNRFLKRVWKLAVSSELSDVQLEDRNRLSMLHKTVKGITEDMEELRYNTTLAKLMTYYNFLIQQPEITQGEVEILLKGLAPFAPHMTEELWQRRFGNDNFASIHLQSWPVYDERFIISDTVTIAVQVNGKLRETLMVESEKRDEQGTIEILAKQSDNVQRFLDGKQIRKIIYVPGKILNFVVS